ncbi:alpha/beta fold hydrolase [Aurantiacibacter sediminis]|uniref:Alpha/beta hydrolase n=1 Tax=Aurantiacibacter sediminis TaxID=2793064 RepID=A0ABS0N292_9SPHN|nr:alpha/beta hydrolase [Aurantiacibacter sediminis]MBH5321837.1 alpha/beta hydrolase [Aurantiacibacter sediminis]
MSEKNVRSPDIDGLIRETYRIVADPMRLDAMQEAIARQSTHLADAAAELDMHFEQASQLFDSLPEREARDFSSFGIDADAVRAAGAPGSLLRLDKSLNILGIDDQRLCSSDLHPGDDFAQWLASDSETMEDALRALAERQTDNAAMVIRFYTSADDLRGTLGLAVKGQPSDAAGVIIRRMGLQWSERDRSVFAEVFGLSDTETELVRFLVEGRSVNDFAADRGRAIGTARTQLKRLQQKLAVGSQGEVISLYAGFIGLLASDSLAEVENGGVFPAKTVEIDGESIRYERVGVAGGTRVILLHGAVEGPFLPDSVIAANRAAGLDLVIPWMPFYTGDQAHLPAPARIESFADKLPAVLDAIGWEDCTIIACSLSTAYGFAALSRHPDRFSGMVLAGMSMPLREIEDRNTMPSSWRAPMELGSHFPRFFELFSRAVFRLAMRGEAHHYFDRLFQDSPRDRATLRNADVARTMRRAAENRPDRFGAAMAHGLAILTTDWSPWLEKCERPVRLIYGAEDVVVPPQQSTDFARRRGLTAVGPIEGVASYCLFQAPAVVFEQVERLHEAD